MSILVDPHICPDCRAPLDPSATCTGCGLRLVGPLASELWQRMQQADRLVEQLRLAPVPAVASAVTSVPAAAPSTLPSAPPPDRPVAPPSMTPRPLPSASVPLVLLSLGGLCLFVAAVVFVAVAWSSLGLAAKTLILLAVTVLVGAAARAVTRRGLRFGAETLWVVVAGLVTVDLAAAYGSNLLGLGRLDDRDAVGLVGACLLGLAVAVGAWASTTTLRRLHCLVGVGAIGAAMLAGAEAWTSTHNPTAVAVSVPALVALAWAIDLATDGHVRPTAVVVAGSAVVSWLELLGYGVGRMATVAGDGTWWTHLSGWPLLAAATYAGAVALVPRVPSWARVLSAGGALVALALLGVGPSTTPTADLLGWAAVSVLLAVVSAYAPLVWARPAAGLTAAALVVWSMLTLVRPWAAIADLPLRAPADALGVDRTLPEVMGGPAAWTAIVAAVVVCVTAAGLLLHVPSAARRDADVRTVLTLGPTVITVGLATAVLETGPSLLVAVLAWSGTLVAAGLTALAARHRQQALSAGLLLALYLALVDLRMASASHLLATLLAGTLAGLVALAYARADRARLGGVLVPALGVAAVLLTGFASAHAPYLVGGRGQAAGITLAVVSGSVIAAARRLGRDDASRLGFECAAFVTGLVATGLPDTLPVVAVVLTVLGTGVALDAVLNVDREAAGWLALPVLGIATAIRVEQDVHLPELSTLPAAVLLLAAGWWRLTGDRSLPSLRALGSGLALGLAPSLLLALDEPVSVRGASVALGGLVALAVGADRRWAAPFLAGAATTALLAVRHLGPVVDGLPRWISLGSVGVALLLVGLTWEQRRRDVATAERYLATLR